MFEPDEIEPVLVETIKAGGTDLRVVDLHEPVFDATEIQQLLTMAPFCLVVCSEEVPENQSGAGGTLGISQEYNMLVGTRSLASKSASIVSMRGILSALRKLLDGKCLLIGEEETPTKPLVWAGNFFEFSEGGLIAFSQRYKLYQY